MTMYRFNIEARKRNLGIKKRYSAVRSGATYSEAIRALYDEFEHVNVVSSEVLPDAPAK
jgi:hypothetical protein